MAAKRRPEGMPRVTLKNIHRAEKNACGWRVHCKRLRREYVKYFPDGWDGPFASLRAAIAWRDELWARLGPPTHVPVKATRRSSTGTLGVTREACRIESGTVVENYRAGWTDAGGTRRRRGFSIDKYGEEVARRMALKARRDGEVAAAKGREGKLLDVLHTHRTLVGDSAAAPGASRRRPTAL